MRHSICVSMLLAAGCTNGASPPVPPPDLAMNPLIAARPYRSQVPTNYDARQPTPLVILLHGYAIDGFFENAVFGLSDLVDVKGFLYAYPDGTKDGLGRRFWNATDACCNLTHSTVDDVAYVDAVIADMSALFNVDPRRTFLIGHSNGAFMSYRFACDRPERVAAIAVLAGDDWKDTAKCPRKQPVALLHAHGDADKTILIGGGNVSAEFMVGDQADYPAARDSVAGWARLNGCAATTDSSAAPLDLVNQLPGAETAIEKWTGCPSSGAVELWTIHGADHAPSFRPDWALDLWGWLSAHPRS